MTKLASRIALALLAAGATLGCSSNPGEQHTIITHHAKACTAESLCTECASCFDSCTCEGGSAARCTQTCGAVAGGPTADGGPSASPPGDAATAGPDLPSTFVADSFDIPPGGETFRCQNFQNPYSRDVAILSSEAFMTVGSHHMFLFIEPDSVESPLTECSGLSFGTYLHLAQRSESIITYPPGVGRILPGTNGLQIMVHYLNSSTETIHAQVAVTIHATEPEKVAIHASQIFANTLGISLPPMEKSTIKHSCGVPKDINLFTAASHMHSHGTYYTARTSDGQLLYETKDWAEPEPWTFTPPRLLKAGSTIDVTCQYDNETNETLSFGESAATNEMCIFVGGYYPAADGEQITCLF
jgi:hypothetical protein